MAEGAALALDDPRLAWICPQPPQRLPDGWRLPRFPRPVFTLLAGQIGPLANLRSSSGCGVRWASDSPWVQVTLAGLRHHQPFPSSIALEVEDAQGLRAVHGPDLRPVQGAVQVWLPTGLERGQGLATLTLWLPPISTCLIAGLHLAAGAAVAAAPPPEPCWLAIGDSLTQGFSVQSPLDTWVHQASRRLGLSAWNLGVGGIRIEPEAFAWALQERSWDLVTIGLGSNHAWRPEDLDRVAERARQLAHLACAGPHRRVAWILPPWKPCEDGLGPPEFQGVPLTRETAARMAALRQVLAEALQPFTPRLTLISDLLPRDASLLSDGLHPAAHGSRLIAERLINALPRSR